jgi:Co/Zn/Cd efflux system component
MDCPSEERLIRLALDGLPGLGALHFDLAARELRVEHHGDAAAITARLQPLKLGAALVETREAVTPAAAAATARAADEGRVLRWLLAINAAMFVVELVAGWWAQSTGLLADSLDMLADAAVYGLALHAVGRGSAQRNTAARAAGWTQLLLALGALAEVARRALLGSEPEPPLMMGIALLALVANASCMALLMRHREGGIHMRASWIFSTNDVLANLGVIVAGALVAWTGARWPDLLVGAVIGLLVLVGAGRILRLRAEP